MTRLDPVLAAALRGALALLFATAAAHKLRAFAGFRATLAAYRLLPPVAVGPFALATVALEIAAALALALGAVASLAAPGASVAASLGGAAAMGPALAASLLAVYTGAIAVNVARGRTDLDCGCLGPALRQPIGAGVLARNAILLAVALACLAPVRQRPLGWLDVFTAALAVATAAALYAASQHLIATGPGLAALRAEVEER